jgi:hypothetical protein
MSAGGTVTAGTAEAGGVRRHRSHRGESVGRTREWIDLVTHILGRQRG